MDRKIKIMQITHNLGIGGLERVVVNLCKNIDRDKYNVSACCLAFKGPFAQELEENGFQVFSPQKYKKNDRFTFWKLKNILQQEKPDIVHTHNTNSLIDGVIASLIGKIPIMVHTDHARKFPDKKKYMILEGFLSKFIDKIIAVSHETKNNLIKYENIKAEKIVVVNNGIDGLKYDITTDIIQKKKELGLEKYNSIVGLGVRLTKQKGIIYLVKSAPKVLKEFPKTAFVIAGQGPLMDELKNETMRLKIKKNFFFIGPRLDMPEILQLLDIFVLPSEWEGLPLVLLEAMAAKRAIIATDVGGNSMAIQNNESGYLVKPKNPDELAEKINILLNNKDQRINFANNAYHRFLEKFSVRKMASEYEKIYETILMQKKIKF